MHPTHERPRRSLLFVPGNRPERFKKAVESGADIVCLDLEDGVQLSDKTLARTKVLQYVAEGRSHCEIAVRINSPRTQLGLRDMLDLAQGKTYPDLIVVPKTESAAEVAWVAEVFGESRQSPGILPLIETLQGIGSVDEIAGAPPTALIGLGTADLSLEMGVTMQWEPMQLARMQLVQAAKRAKIPAVDGAWLQIDDVNGLTAEAKRSAALGFTAKVCLHPKQVEAVHSAFAPTVEQLEHARELVAAYEASNAGVVLFKGRMVDLPVVTSARKLLARSESGKQR